MSIHTCTEIAIKGRVAVLKAKLREGFGFIATEPKFLLP